MSLVNNLQIPFSSDAIVLPEWEHGESNRFTILIGENGTRKSLILREMLDDSLAKIAIERSNQKSLSFDGVNMSKSPEKIIALSAIATDRFPSKSLMKKNGRWTKYDEGSYSYIGPRTAQNLISRNQSVLEVILAILNKPKSAFNQTEFLLDILKEIGLTGQFTLGLSYPFRMNLKSAKIKDTFRLHLEELLVSGTDSLDRSSHFLTQIGNYFPNFSWPPNRETEELISEIDNFAVDAAPSQAVYKNLSDAKKKLSKASYRINLNYENKNSLEISGPSRESLHFAVLTGYLKPTSIFFTKQSGELVDQEELSAGQWSLFSSMVSLATLVEDNTLILIDEPESALHPTWQRGYLSYLRQAISHVKWCQAIIATHSPIILSSLTLENSDVITLHRNRNNETINWNIIKPPSGWRIDEILDETFQMDGSRGTQFTEIVDNALRLIAGGIAKNRDELENAVLLMRPYLLNLPESDLARAVIHSIIDNVERPRINV